MRADLSRLESLGAKPPGSKIEPGKQPEIPKVQTTDPGYCPARCKQTGKCYGKAFFIGKPGKVQDCVEPCYYTK